MARLCEHTLSHGALAHGHAAAAETALGKTALPQVADFPGREATLDLAEKTGEERATAPAGPGDVDD